MILDAENLFSSQQAILGATVVSTNAIDLTAPRNVGVGTPLRLIAEVIAAFAGGTSLQVNLITSANSDLSSPTVLASSPAYLTAALSAGMEIARFDWPAAVQGQTQRYLGLQYVPVGTFTAGTVTAGLALDRQAAHSYPSALNMGYV